MAELRPYGSVVSVTNVRGLLSEEDSCEWRAQFLSRHTWDSWEKMPDAEGEGLANWKLRHPEVLFETREKWRADDYTVYSENENRFRLKGRAGTLFIGKPDLVARKGDEGIIIDVKTGMPREADIFQVMCYMWGVPLDQNLNHHGVKFDGLLVYDDGTTRRISAAAIDEAFVERLGRLITRVAGEAPAVKAPSWQECQFCKITSTDCPERVEEEPEATGTEVFA